MNLFKTKRHHEAKLSQQTATLSPKFPVISREQVAAWTSRMESNIQREMKTFQDILPQLLKDQPGKFVAISDGKLIGVDSNEHHLVEKVSRENGGQFVLIQEVTAKAFSRTQARL